jgi:hypothetical protein
MRRETEAFLDLVRDAEDPTGADEARVQRSLRAAIAAGVGPSVDPSAEINGSFEGTSFGDALAKLGLSGAKLNLLAVCAAATLAAGDTALPRGADALGELRAPVPAAAAPPLNPGAAEPAAPAFDAEPAAPPFKPEPEAPKAVPSTAVPSRSVPSKPVPIRAKPRARAAAAPAAPAAASSLRAELELLQRVQAALKRGEASSALRALDAHQTTDATLLAERRAARILALCQLGKIDDARRAAADFVKQHPDSLQRAAVDGSCANR